MLLHQYHLVSAPPALHSDVAEQLQASSSESYGHWNLSTIDLSCASTEIKIPTQACTHCGSAAPETRASFFQTHSQLLCMSSCCLRVGGHWNNEAASSRLLAVTLPTCHLCHIPLGSAGEPWRCQRQTHRNLIGQAEPRQKSGNEPRCNLSRTPFHRWRGGLAGLGLEWQKNGSNRSCSRTLFLRCALPNVCSIEH